MKKQIVIGSTVVLALAIAWGCSSSSTTNIGGGDSGAGDSSSSQKDSGVIADSGTTDSGSQQLDAAGEQSIDITFGNCTAFTPCGGSIVGTWDFTTACTDDPLAAFEANCPTLVENSISGTVKGRQLNTATTIQQNTNTSVKTNIDLPKSCLPAIAQAFPCATIGTQIGSAIPGATGTCTDADAGTPTCNCDITVTSSSTTNDTYTQSGDNITASSGTYAFCVAPTGGTYQVTQTATADGGTPTPATYTLTKE